MSTIKQYRLPWTDRFVFCWAARACFLSGLGCASVSAGGFLLPRIVHTLDAPHKFYGSVDTSDRKVLRIREEKPGTLLAEFDLDCTVDPKLPDSVAIDPIELDESARGRYKLGQTQASRGGVPLSTGVHGMSGDRPGYPYAYRQSFSLDKIDRTQKTTIEIRIHPEKSATPKPPFDDIRGCLHITLTKSEGIKIAE